MKQVLLCGAAALALAAAPAHAAYLVSGSGEGSTYKNGYAGPIVEAVSPFTEAALFGEVEDRDGSGTVGNLETCAAEKQDMCFGIGQGNIVAKSPQVANGEVCIIRADLEPEYGFAFLNNKRLKDYGAIRKNWEAGRISFVVSSTSSGSRGTLEEIRAAAGFDPAKAKIEELGSWDAVIREVKRNPRAVGFTHRFADPSGFLSDLVDDHDLTVTGMAERALRREKHANGEPVYTVNTHVPYDTEGVLGAGGVATTASLGTPVVLFGNCPDKMTEFGEDAAEVHAQIAKLPREDFAVDLGWMADISNTIAATAEQGGADEGWKLFDDMIKKGGELLE